MRAGSTILLNLIAVLAAVLFSLAPLAADAADRVALVIGNAAYSDASKLKNPRNDAEAITATLERLDFEVIKGVDLEGDALKAVVRDFSRALETAKVALFFYAGHGMQVNGRNFLIPVDAKLGCPRARPQHLEQRARRDHVPETGDAGEGNDVEAERDQRAAGAAAVERGVRRVRSREPRRLMHEDQAGREQRGEERSAPPAIRAYFITRRSRSSGEPSRGPMSPAADGCSEAWSPRLPP